MEADENKGRNSVRNLKPKSFSFKELSKLVKKASTPSSRRDLLQQIYIPITAVVKYPYKTFEKCLSSMSKRKTSKSSKKPRPLKKSETTTHLGNETKTFKLSPKKTPLKKKIIRTPSRETEKPAKRAETSKKIRKKSSSVKKSDCTLGFRTKTGSINGKTKPNNQDDFFVIHDFGNSKGQTFLGVMDGHGLYGHEVSAFIKKELPLFIENFFPSSLNESKFGVEYLEKLEKCFKDGFKNTQRALVNKKTIDINYSGSTAITVLLRNKLCICSNLGDSRAAIGRFNDSWVSVELSHDHKPSDLYERHRIEISGGRVEPFKEENGELVGPDRVWLKHEQLPGLAMSRSFGDMVAQSVGVISEPEIFIHNLVENDKFIVIASDGIWEFISSQECVNIIGEFYAIRDVERACDSLMKKAIDSWVKEDTIVDDITFIVIFLQ